jgi:hypothetical protein
MASLYFWRPFQDSCPRRHGGTTGVLFRVPTVPCSPPLPPATRNASLNWDCRLYVSGLIVRSLFRPPSYLLHPLRAGTATVMARKKATADELDARAEANGYQRGAHREEDSRRDGNKHKDTTTKNQDITLDHYVM